MRKRELLAIARQVQQVGQPSIASDLVAIAENSRDDEQREWLAYCEMCRYTREGETVAASLLWRAIYPAQAAIYR